MPAHTAVPDPMSEPLAKAAQEAINVDILPDLIDTLARSDTSFVKLKRFSIKQINDIRDPVVKKVVRSKRETRKPEQRTELNSIKPKQELNHEPRPQPKRPELRSPVAALNKVSTVDIQTRSAQAPDFKRLGSVSLSASQGMTARQPSDRDERLLVAACQETFNTLLTVYQAWTASGRGTDQNSEANIFFDEELTSLAKAFGRLGSALQTCTADCLFQSSQELHRHMPDVIRCCEAQARAARHASIMSLQDDMDTRAALLLQAGLEAASVLIRLCAADSCPQQLLQEAALDTVCALIAEVTNSNLLAFFNAAVRQDVRPDLHGMPIRVSSTESKGKLVKCGKYLSVVITAAVEGLRALSWRVSLKNSSLTSALKALAGVLHTPALSNMHTSIISLFIRVYDSSKQDGTAACLDVLGLMIKPFISQILDNSVLKGCHLLNGVYVKPVTLSVLNLVHAEAQIPILGSSESDIQGFFTPILHLCNDFWGQLLEQICQKPGHEPKLAKAAVEGIISELAALLPHAEWPGAHVLLHVLCKCLVDVLHTGKGASGGLEISREDRELLLDVAGFLVARIMPHLEEPDTEAKALFMGLLSLQQGTASTGDAAVGEPPPPFSMQLLRRHEGTLQLLLGAWLQCDGNLDAASATSVRRCSAALSLFSNVERVRANEARPVQAVSPLTCRPEENLQSSLAAAHAVLTFSASDTATEALLDMVLLSPAQAAALHSVMLYGSLLRQCVDYLLMRITRAAVPATESSMKIRASAWRALAQVLAVAPRILQFPSAQAALSSALSDKEKSATVQDKALDILAHHMQGNAAACIAHLPMIQAAARHNATSVRKRAVDILWDCYINAPAIAERNRSLVTRLLTMQLHMFDDQEPSMRSKLLDAFRARWFSARTMEEARAPAAELCLILRALAVDRDMLPMPHDYVLRRLLHTILHGDPDLGSSRRSAAASHCENARQAAVLMADVMLGAVLDGADENQQRNTDDTQAAHVDEDFEGAALVILAFATVDVGLVMPSAGDAAHATSGRRAGGSNTFKFFEPLRLQLRGAPKAVATALGRDKPGMHVITRIRAVMLATTLLLNEARKKDMKPSERSMAEMLEDLEQLLRLRMTGPMTNNTCQALAAVALSSPQSSLGVESFCEGVYEQLVRLLEPITTGQAVDPKAERLFRKYLTILPALLRYLAPHPRVMQLQGPKFDFATGRSTSERRCICHSIFDIATNTSKLPASLQDPVLSSLMQLLIGFPAECNDFSAQVLPVLQRHLSAGAGPQVIHRVLSSLSELVRTEELECLQAVEQQKEEHLPDSKDRAKVELAKVNGMNEGISNAGAIIQSLWGSATAARGPAGGIAFAMLYTGPPADAISTNDHADAVQQVPKVRLEGVALLDLVQRSGAVAPWLYLPPVLVLCLDSSPSTSDRALRILQRCAAKLDMHNYIAEVLASALELALQGHLRMHAALTAIKERVGRDAPLQDYWPNTYKRFSFGLYRTVIEPNRSLRSRFLASVRHAADAATNASESDNGTTPAQLHGLHFFAQLLAAVALTDRDDVLRVLSHLNSLVSRRADAIQVTVAASLGEEDGEAHGAAGTSHDAAAPLPDTGLSANTIRQHRRACVGMCMVLLLKRFLVQAYHVKEEMLQTFNPTLKKQEGVVDRRKDAELRLAVDLNAAEEPAQMPAQFAAFKQLLADDTDDYSAAHIAAGLAPPSGKGRKPRQPRAGADGEGGPARAGKAGPKKKGRPKKRPRDSDNAEDE